MKKRRINVYCCFSGKNDACKMKLAEDLEIIAALEGVKVYAFTPCRSNESEYDWGIKQQIDKDGLINACDVIVIDNFTPDIKKELEQVIPKSKVFLFKESLDCSKASIELDRDIGDFDSFIKYSKELLNQI